MKMIGTFSVDIISHNYKDVKIIDIWILVIIIFERNTQIMKN